MLIPYMASASDEFIQWHSTNIQFLRGHSYKVGDKHRTIMTLEHANEWQYGDFFVFMDQIWPDEGKSTFYVEPLLRFSYNKINGEKIDNAIIKDVLLATSIEKPKGADLRYLNGLGVDLNIPGFNFFKTNWLHRNDSALDGSTYQLTLAWNYPFQIEGTKFLIEGFADFAGKEDTSNTNQLIVPRFLVDVGDLANVNENTLWMGLEYSYWHNKFGIKGVTESVAQLQVKWVF